MLQYLLTFVVLAQPAQPAAAVQGATAAATTANTPVPAEGTTTPPAGTTQNPGIAGNSCDPNAPRPGKKKREMPPPPERTDLGAGTFWMPPSAATNTDAVDWLFYGILGLTIFCFGGITIAVVYFTIKYRGRSPDAMAPPSDAHNDALEITWTIIPSIICVFLFILGWRGFIDLNTPPKHAYEIQVIGEKWNWTFKYPNGWVDNNLHVPVNEPVRLVMRSKDVIHSFYVPSFRVKQDVLPNRYTKIWFQATKPGVYRLYCAEYCGQGHSQMKRLVIVHPTAESPPGETPHLLTFNQYMEEAEQVLLDMPPVALGKYLYETRGCQQCHSLDGTVKTGPSWLGIWGKHESTSAGAVDIDENYIRESILEPSAKVVTGFNAVMPTFKGQLKDEQIDGIITFIKCLKK